MHWSYKVQWGHTTPRGAPPPPQGRSTHSHTQSHTLTCTHSHTHAHSHTPHTCMATPNTHGHRTHIPNSRASPFFPMQCHARGVAQRAATCADVRYCTPCMRTACLVQLACCSSCPGPASARTAAVLQCTARGWLPSWGLSRCAAAVCSAAAAMFEGLRTDVGMLVLLHVGYRQTRRDTSFAMECVDSVDRVCNRA